MSTKIKSFAHLFIAVFITQFIQIRPYLSKNFYGDPFDGRLQIVLHEHWWRFLRGETSLRNTEFFYPFDKGLGLSDPFVIQGIIHSLFRSINFDMYESWALSVAVMILLGNIGMALLASKLITNRILQILFVLLGGISYTYIAHIQSHPNITGIALIPFVIYFLIDFRKHLVKSISSILVLFPVLMLTSWYASFFLALFLFVLILTTKNLKVVVLECIDESRKKLRIIIPSLIFSLVSLLLFLYIHLPVLSSNIRTNQEMILNSPNFSNIMNGSQLGGGVFSRIYEFLGFQEEQFYYEYQIGLTFSVFSITLFIAIFFLLNFRHRNKYAFLIKLYLINVVILSVFFVVGKSSAFSYLYEHFKVFSSIRVPIRYLIFFATINIFVFLKIIDLNPLKYLKSRWLIVTTTLLLILVLDQFRLNTSEFKKSSFQGDTNLTKILKTNPECKSFILSTEGLEWWDDQLQAMITSAESGLPTVNGYSGGFPNGYPNLNWRSKSDLLSVGKWLTANNAEEKSCVLRRNLVESFNPKIFVDSNEGFDLIETNGKDVWRWSIASQSSLKLINYRKQLASDSITLDLQLPKCSANSNVNIQIGSGVIQSFKIESDEKKSIKLNYSINGESEQYLNFFIEGSGCTVNEDPRKLYFNVSNIQVN